MFITALLMGVALKDGQPLSDGEIRVRAMALGMVDGDSRTLAGIQASQTPEQSPPVTAEPTNTPEETALPTPTAAPAATADPAETPVPTESPAAPPAPTAEPAATPASAANAGVEDPPKPLAMVTPKPAAAGSPESADVPSQTPEPSESVTFVIRSGQSSYGVSKSLVEAGLVEDASDFDRYLEDNGYSKRISTGTYEIPVGSTEEEIAKIITRSR